ncbi:MAG: aminotransferase class III-fold pyridoxal phosphate-dependent enzyme [Pseudomonadota bacterium]
MADQLFEKASIYGHVAPTGRTAEEQELIARRSAALGPAYKLFYDPPLHLVRGEGVWLFDQEGRRYLDAYNNVPSVGHSHPRVLEALARQSALLNTHTRYLNDQIVDYAEDLLGLLPQAIDRIMFTCTGSEANDLALRVAQQATDGTGIVATDLAYHGGTAAVAAFSPSLGGKTPPHVRLVAAPSAYHDETGDVGARFATDVASAFADLKAAGHEACFFIFDSIFSSDGVLPDPAGFLRGAVDAARAAGALIVADEVQPGFGRTGGHFWGFVRHGIAPDLVTMGKPMAAGHPVAAVAGRAEIMDQFGQASRYFNTFGGTPVAAAVAQTVLDVIREEALMAHAAQVGGQMLADLRNLAASHEVIGDVRGAGLFLGVELVTVRAMRAPATQLSASVVNEMRARGVLISRAGPGANCLKIRPPLPFSQSNAEMLVETLDAVLRERTR